MISCISEIVFSVMLDHHRSFRPAVHIGIHLNPDHTDLVGSGHLMSDDPLVIRVIKIPFPVIINEH